MFLWCKLSVLYVGCFLTIGSNAEKFDGVAVNNEAYNKVKSSEDVSIVTLYLDRLQEVHLQARKQVRDRLLTHYSIGWHWGRRNGETQIIPWRGKSVDVLHHMIDIFDSIDVQVISLFPFSSLLNRICQQRYSNVVNAYVFHFTQISGCIYEVSYD